MTHYLLLARSIKAFHNVERRATSLCGILNTFLFGFIQLALNQLPIYHHVLGEIDGEMCTFVTSTGCKSEPGGTKPGTAGNGPHTFLTNYCGSQLHKVEKEKMTGLRLPPVLFLRVNRYRSLHLNVIISKMKRKVQGQRSLLM